jgi:hypothetical protein
MARTGAELPCGTRLTDYISVGVLTKMVPQTTIDNVLRRTGKASLRQRELPAQVMVYYVMGLALYRQSSYREVLRCLLEGVQWLLGPDARVTVTGKSGISQARTRLGWQPLQSLPDEIVKPMARKETKGAWSRTWRLVSLDGSTLDVADEPANARRFGRPAASRGRSAFPQLRFVSLVENGTQVVFGTHVGGADTGEIPRAKAVLPSLRQGMLCLADRNFYGFALWTQARGTGTELLWRIKQNLRLPDDQRLPDGSYLSRIYATPTDQRHRRDGVVVRVIEYRLEGVPAEPRDRLLTTILDPDAAPAAELAALYHERWEIETALDELKTHLRGARIVLRSKTPDLVLQEFYGLLLAHFAIRGLRHEAALKGEDDPDRLSFLHAVRVVRRPLPRFAALPPSGPARLS